VDVVAVEDPAGVRALDGRLDAGRAGAILRSGLVDVLTICVDPSSFLSNWEFSISSRPPEFVPL
jgi:hypothetical protein